MNSPSITYKIYLNGNVNRRTSSEYEGRHYGLQKCLSFNIDDGYASTLTRRVLSILFIESESIESEIVDRSCYEFG